MSALEITLLVLGLIAFFVSFFIPDKQGNNEIDSISQDEIRNIIDGEIESIRDKLANSADETISYSVEKAERSLERLTNEKMIALGEYSDTIFNQINKNHQETVFLSDMLSKNKKDLTVLLGQASTDSKIAQDSANKAIELASEAYKQSQSALSNARNAKELVIFAEDKIIGARKEVKTNGLDNKPVKKLSKVNGETESFVNSDEESNIIVTEESKPVQKKTTRRKSKVEPVMKDGVLVDNDGQISLKFDADEETSKNSNDMVLKLHKKGKSNVAIAKELGLGIGEVKLVIDLFENKKK